MSQLLGCIRRYVDRSGCFRSFLSSVHEVSAVSAIFSAFASDNIGCPSFRITTAGSQTFSCRTRTTLQFRQPLRSSVIVLLVLVLTLLQLALSTDCGVNNLDLAGSLARSMRLISICAVENNAPAIGVLQYSSSATYGSRPSQSAFFKMCFSVCTARSLCPFDCGKLGLDVISFMPQTLPKLVNSWLANGMLSLIISSGIPCLAKIDLSWMMTFDAVLFSSSAISGYSVL